MKKLPVTQTNRGLTLIELLVVASVIAVLLAVMLAPNHRMRRGNLINCMSNLHIFVTASRMYALDNHGKLPMEIPPAENGRMESDKNQKVFPIFQKLAPYLGNPSFLVCPTDKNRYRATNFGTLTDQNSSYFLNLDASTNKPPVTILAGDRNLQADGQAVPSGRFVLQRGLDMAWTHELHPTGGTLAYADGHVAFCLSENLNTVVTNQGLLSFRLAIP